jgi:3-oxoacyl-[acyl-carrier protein] reductase
VVTDIDAKKANAVAESINADGGTAISVPGDITSKTFPQKLIDETIKAFGKLNILINNAGYTWDGMVHKMSDDQWDAMLLVHNTAPFRIVRAAAPYLRDAGKAEMDAGKTPENRCIINISSTSGLHGNAGQANYSTAKMGIVGFTKTIAKEWGAFGVRSNGIAYGWIETRLTADKNKGAFMQVGDKKVALGIPGADQRGATSATGAIPLKRAGKAIEAAGAMLLLASPHASYITGHTLEVTGGSGI